MQEKEKKCPECGSRDIVSDTIKGEIVCKRCGAVIEEDIIDTGQEWRAFDDTQTSRRVRAGAPLSITKHDQGLTTEIGKGKGELFKVSAKKRAQYYRISKWHKRLIKSRDRNLSFAFSELQRLISYLGLSQSIHKSAAKLYEKAVDMGLVKGRSTESIISAILYIVCREEGVPRTLEEISDASGVNKREIGKTYRYIARKLDFRILPAKPQNYIPRFASLLKLDEKVQVRAKKLLDDASKKKEGISGKGPIGVAAAAIYLAALIEGKKKTQREVAEVLGVTEVTIRNRYKEIADSLGITEMIEKLIEETEKEFKEKK